MKGKPEGSTSEEESDDGFESPPLNNPRHKNRSPPSARPRDVRPKEPQFSARWTDGQNKESTTGASPGVVQLQVPADVQTLKSFVDIMADEAKQTNNHLFKLTEHLEEQKRTRSGVEEQKHTRSGGSNQNTSAVNPSFYGLGAANVASVYLAHSGKDDDNIRSPRDDDNAQQLDKERMQLTMRIEEINRQKNRDKKYRESLDPEHNKFVDNVLSQFIDNPELRPEAVPEIASRENKGGSKSGHGRRDNSSAPDPRGQAWDAGGEGSAAGSRRRPGASPHVGQHTGKTKGKPEGSISEEESDDGSESSPLNIPRPENSRPFPHRNKIYDPNPPPKARSYDTVLCLDTSESMLQGNAAEQMMNIAKEFINGVEDMTSDVEENIGLVTFGGRTNIIQHLTNDFSLIREALQRIEFGGSSPFFEAIVVCLGAFDGKGGTVSVSGEYEVHPRIIFLTDGHITEGNDDAIDRVIDATNTRTRFIRLMMDLNPKKDPSMPHPIVFVPVGTKADQTFLMSMAELNDGQVIKPENLNSICNYYKIQEAIGKVIVCMHNLKTEDTSEHQIEAVVLALMPNINKQEMEEVTAGVCREMKNPSRKRGRTDPTAFDDVHEHKVCPPSLSPTLGASQEDAPIEFILDDMGNIVHMGPVVVPVPAVSQPPSKSSHTTVHSRPQSSCSVSWDSDNISPIQSVTLSPHSSASVSRKSSTTVPSSPAAIAPSLSSATMSPHPPRVVPQQPSPIVSSCPSAFVPYSSSAAPSGTPRSVPRASPAQSESERLYEKYLNISIELKQHLKTKFQQTDCIETELRELQKQKLLSGIEHAAELKDLKKEKLLLEIKLLKKQLDQD